MLFYLCYSAGQPYPLYTYCACAYVYFYFVYYWIIVHIAAEYLSVEAHVITTATVNNEASFFYRKIMQYAPQG